MPSRPRPLRDLLTVIDDAFDVAPEHRGIYTDEPAKAVAGIVLYTVVTLTAANGVIALAMATLGESHRPLGYIIMAILSGIVLAGMARQYHQLTHEPPKHR